MIKLIFLRTTLLPQQTKTDWNESIRLIRWIWWISFLDP